MKFLEFHFTDQKFVDYYVLTIEYDRYNKTAVVDCDDEELKSHVEDLLRIKNNFPVGVGDDRLDKYVEHNNKYPTDDMNFMGIFCQTLWQDVPNLFLSDIEEVVDG